MADSRDYLWTLDYGSGFYDYCVALIGTSSPDAVLADLHASNERSEARGLDQALRGAQSFGEELGVDGVDRQLAAVTDAGTGWTLLVQMPGYIGVSSDSMSRHCSLIPS